MNKHTPGPWTAEPARGGGYCHIVSPKALGQVATVHNSGSNARLIAAAPELLAALRELVAEHDARELPQGHYARDTGGVSLARAAITKAEGGTV